MQFRILHQGLSHLSETSFSQYSDRIISFNTHCIITAVCRYSVLIGQKWDPNGHDFTQTQYSGPSKNLHSNANWAQSKASQWIHQYRPGSWLLMDLWESTGMQCWKCSKSNVGHAAAHGTVYSRQWGIPIQGHRREEVNNHTDAEHNKTSRADSGRDKVLEFLAL